MATLHRWNANSLAACAEQIKSMGILLDGLILNAESFFSSLKKERIRKRIYKTRDMAKADIFDYIEMFYNKNRRHSYIGGVSPEAFERASFLGLALSTVSGGVHIMLNRKI